MHAISGARRYPNRAILAFGLVAFASFWNCAPARAEPSLLPPHTRIRVTIVQWVSAKGSYEKWEALGGDFEIADDATVSLPVVGTLPVSGLDPAQLSAKIAARLQTKIGLVQTPEATVAIIAYPPVYVVGDVEKPGEYKFDAGLTVLHCLALSGGEVRQKKDQMADKTGLVSLLRGLDNSILRSEIKIARLQAEMSGAKEIGYTLPSTPERQVAAAILGQEEAIFAAQANLLERQTKSYAELRESLAQEIGNLEKKKASSEQDIASLDNELRRIRPFVEKKLMLPSQQDELERTIRSYYAGQLDLSTAILRARQGISEASRNIEGLHDKQETEVALELQTEQSNLFQLEVKKDTAQKQLLAALSTSDDAESEKLAVLDFTVIRRANGTLVHLAASESTSLQPGDVVRVTRKLSHVIDTAPADAVSDATSRIESGQTSQ
jgi:hypothetical protein